LMMSVQSRLSKNACRLIKAAQSIIFVRWQADSGTQKVVALAQMAEWQHPLILCAGAGFWDAHDLDKAKRSIKRHNKDLVFIDRRDFIFCDVSDLSKL
ncbi:hypothetical protein, partial [Acinetobacter towneri]|uniref:hypothetical protein n=1 Tax=Acinetobacter towneri TaxID=202956 RepID=UPI003A84DD42